MTDFSKIERCVPGAIVKVVLNNWNNGLFTIKNVSEIIIHVTNTVFTDNKLFLFHKSAIYVTDKNAREFKVNIYNKDIKERALTLRLDDIADIALADDDESLEILIREDKYRTSVVSAAIKDLKNSIETFKRRIREEEEHLSDLISF